MNQMSFLPVYKYLSLNFYMHLNNILKSKIKKMPKIIKPKTYSRNKKMHLNYVLNPTHISIYARKGSTRPIYRAVYNPYTYTNSIYKNKKISKRP